MPSPNLGIESGKAGRIVDHVLQESADPISAGSATPYDLQPDSRGRNVTAGVNSTRPDRDSALRVVTLILFGSCMMVLIVLYGVHLAMAGLVQVSALHPVLGGVYLVALAAAATILIVSAIRLLVEYRSLRNISGLQSMARLAACHVPVDHHGARKAIVEYLDEIQARADFRLNQSIDQLRIKFGQYAGDSSRDFGLLNDLVLEQIDRQVEARLAEGALHVAIATALASRVFDPLIVSTYAIKTVRQTATAYRGRPGFIGTINLGARAMSAAVFAEVADVIADALSQLTGIKLAAKLSARLGEGLSNGFVMLRLGEATKRLCRPVEPPAANYRHSLAQLVSALVSQTQCPADAIMTESPVA